MQRHIPQLDAVRGFAILLVLAHNMHGFHAPPFGYLTAYGWMGVDLFFVLSGFLITGILLDTKPSKTYFRNFYVRRILRIWPLYYSVLFIMFVLMPTLLPQQSAEIFQRSNPCWSYPFFLQNFLVANSSESVGPLGVTWSLAIEELFYLIWPVFVRFLSGRQLQAVICGAVLLSPFVRLFFLSHNRQVYSNPFCRIDGLMVGALLASLVRKPGFAPGRWIAFAWMSVFIAASLAIIAELRGARWLTFSLDIFAFAGFLYLAVFSRSAWIKAFFTNRFLMFTGTISYGLYLLHKLPHDALKMSPAYRVHPYLGFLAALVLSYALAIASWNLLEKPFLRLKRFFESTSLRVEESTVPLASSQDSQAT